MLLISQLTEPPFNKKPEELLGLGLVGWEGMLSNSSVFTCAHFLSSSTRVNVSLIQDHHLAGCILKAALFKKNVHVFFADLF